MFKLALYFHKLKSKRKTNFQSFESLQSTLQRQRNNKEKRENKQ